MHRHPFIIVSLWLLIAGAAGAKVILVSDDGTGDFQQIQAAIDAATPGDIVQVTSGTYREAITIQKSVYLKGAGADSTRIEYDGPSVVIQVHSVEAGEIDGFTIAYTGSRQRSTVWLSDSNITLINSVISGGFFSGIALTNGSNPIVRRNRIEANRRTGIQIAEARGTISDNVISGNDQHGIRVVSGISPIIEKNQINKNLKDGVHITEGSTAIIIHNRISENGLNGIDVDRGSTVTILGNRIVDNVGNGIRINDASEGIISKNLVLRSNYSGLHIRGRSNPLIDHNTIANSRLHGIFAHEESTPTIQYNIIAYNLFGIAAGTGELDDKNGQPLLIVNDVWGNTSQGYVELPKSLTDLAVDPRFVAPTEDDFHLQADSPVIGVAPNEGTLGAFPPATVSPRSNTEIQPSGIEVQAPADQKTERPYLVEVGETFQLTIQSFSSAGTGNSISYSPLPNGATFDKTTGLLQWVPDWAQIGLTTITFIAHADTSARPSEREKSSIREIKVFVWKQNTPPRISHINERELEPYESPSYDVKIGEQLRLVFRAEDVDQDSLTFSAVALPVGAYMAGNALIWEPQIPIPSETPILVTVSDGQEIDAVDLTLNVLDAPAIELLLEAPITSPN